MRALASDYALIDFTYALGNVAADGMGNQMPSKKHKGKFAVTYADKHGNTVAEFHVGAGGVLYTDPLELEYGELRSALDKAALIIKNNDRIDQLTRSVERKQKRLALLKRLEKRKRATEHAKAAG